MCIIISFLIQTACLIAVIILLQRPGTNQGLKKEILLRYVLLYALLFPDFMVQISILFPHPYNHFSFNSPNNYLIAIWLISIAAIRISEPQVWKQFKKKVNLEFRCCLRCCKKNRYSRIKVDELKKQITQAEILKKR